MRIPHSKRQANGAGGTGTQHDAGTPGHPAANIPFSGAISGVAADQCQPTHISFRAAVASRWKVVARMSGAVTAACARARRASSLIRGRRTVRKESTQRGSFLAAAASTRSTAATARAPPAQTNPAKGRYAFTNAP